MLCLVLLGFVGVVVWVLQYELTRLLFGFAAEPAQVLRSSDSDLQLSIVYYST